jgi:hypothetical protein
MQIQDPQQPKPQSRTVWYVAGGLLLACCCVVMLVVVLAAPTLQNTLNQISNSVQATNEAGGQPGQGQPGGSGPVNGGLGDATLKTDVWNSIVGYYAGKQCTDVTSLNIEVTQPIDAQGVWQEAWTVNACGQTEILNVKFTPSAQGGTDYAITQ